MGVPMEVVAVDGWTATCVARGVEKLVNIMLVLADDVAVGGFVLVHRDHALQVLTDREAREAWSVLDEALALEDDAHPV